jgi:hypothetical protein
MSTGKISTPHKSTPPVAVPGSASPTAGVVFVLYYVYTLSVLSIVLENVFTLRTTTFLYTTWWWLRARREIGAKGKQRPLDVSSFGETARAAAGFSETRLASSSHQSLTAPSRLLSRPTAPPSFFRKTNFISIFTHYLLLLTAL